MKDYGTIDGQRAADIALKKVSVPASSLVGAEGKAFAAIEAAHDQALSALCAEAVGIMKAVNATTLEYTKSRKQFGQPIGASRCCSIAWPTCSCTASRRAP